MILVPGAKTSRVLLQARAELAVFLCTPPIAERDGVVEPLVAKAFDVQRGGQTSSPAVRAST